MKKLKSTIFFAGEPVGEVYTEEPFETVKVSIPYETGMDEYSGLFEMFHEDMDILKKSANSYIYTSPVDGTEIKKFKKAWKLNTDGCLDKVMAEFDKIDKSGSYNIAGKLTANDTPADNQQSLGQRFPVQGLV